MMERCSETMFDQIGRQLAVREDEGDAAYLGRTLDGTVMGD